MSQCLGFSSTWFSLRFPGRLTLLLSTQWITSTTEGRKFGKGLTLAVILGISSELFSLERNSDILPFFGITHHMTPSNPHPSPSVHPHTPTPPQLSTSHPPSPPHLSTLTPHPSLFVYPHTPTLTPPHLPDVFVSLNRFKHASRQTNGF